MGTTGVTVTEFTRDGMSFTYLEKLKEVTEHLALLKFNAFFFYVGKLFDVKQS